MPVEHWIPRDAARDIAAEALRSDRARPVEIRVHRRLAYVAARLPVVVDPTIPFSPGFEVRRAPPAA